MGKHKRTLPILQRMISLILSASVMLSGLSAGAAAASGEEEETIGKSGANITMTPDEPEWPGDAGEGAVQEKDPYAYQEVSMMTLGASMLAVTGKTKIAGNVNFSQGIHTDVAGIIVRLMQTNGVSSMKEVARYTLKADGKYVFNGVADGEYIIMVDATDAYAQVRMLTTVNANDALAQIVNVALTENGVTAFKLSGKVSGVPVVENIVVKAVNTAGALIQQVKTSKDGSYAFNALPHGDCKIRVEKSDTYAAFEKAVHVQYSHITGENIQLSRRYSISGNVTGTDKAAGIKVELYRSPNTKLQTAIAGSDGAYSFKGLEAGNYVLRVAEGTDYFAFEKTVTVGKDDLKVDIQLSRKCAIAGSVTGVDKVAGLKVDLHSSSNAKLQTATVGADGKYSFKGLASGAYILRVAAGADYYAYERTVVVGQEDLTHDIWLQRFGFSQVRVETAAHQPLANVYVYARQVNNHNNYQSGSTNANGEWRFNWDSGVEYEVVASYAGKTVSMKVTDQPEVVLTFPDVVIITGTVMDTAGNPKPGYTVTIQRSDGSRWSVRTNSQGIYRLDVADDPSVNRTYTITTSYIIRYVKAEKSEALTLNLDSITVKPTLDLTVYPCEASGAVYGKDGKPLGGVQIGGGYAFSTGPDGKFMITGVLNSYSINISHSGYKRYHDYFTFVLDKAQGKFVANKKLDIYLTPTDVNSTDYTISLKSTSTTAAIGDDVTLRPVIHRNRTGAGSAVRLSFTLPENVEMRSPGSFKLKSGRTYECSLNVTQTDTSVDPITVKILNANSEMLNFSMDLFSGNYKMQPGVLSINVLYATISGPSTHPSGSGITIFGNASRNSEIRIKNKYGGMVYAETQTGEFNQFYSTLINLAPGENGSVKRYELIAEVRAKSGGDGKYYASAELIIDVGSGVTSLQDIVITDSHRREHRSHPLYGIPVYAEYVYNDYQNGGFYGSSFNVQFAVSNGNGWKPSIVFGGKTASISLSSSSSTNDYVYYRATIPYRWKTSGGIEELHIKLTNGKETIDYHAATLRMMIDPSGYIYDVDTGERIVGATVILEKKTDGVWMRWEDWDGIQQNPQLSDEEGRFAWFTEEGTYRVRVSKAGYTNIDGGEEAIANTAHGGFDPSIPDDSSLSVLPVQLDVNVPLKKFRREHGSIAYTPPDSSPANPGPVSGSIYNPSYSKTYPISDTISSPAKNPSINTFESQIHAAKDGSIVSVTMNRQTLLSPRTLAALKGRDVHLLLDFGWYQWTLYGGDINDIPAGIKPFELALKRADSVAADEMRLLMAQSGPLPMKMVLTVQLAESFTGTEAFLYTVLADEASLMDNSEITSNQLASFVVDRLGDFIITAQKLRASDAVKYNPETGGSTEQIALNKEVSLKNMQPHTIVEDVPAEQIQSPSLTPSPAPAAEADISPAALAGGARRDHNLPGSVMGGLLAILAAFAGFTAVAAWRRIRNKH